MKRRNNKKGNISLLLVFFITFLSIALIFGVLAPIGANFNTKLYEAGEDILQDAIDDLDQIDDPEIRASLNETLSGAKNNAINNIEINANLYKYAWIITIGILSIVLFLFTRRNVEVGTSFT